MSHSQTFTSTSYVNFQTGIAGKVALMKRPLLVFDTTSCEFHSENVDLKSSLPLYTVPVIVDQKYELSQHNLILHSKQKDTKTIGVIEIVLQKRASMKEARIDPEFENIAKKMDTSIENSVFKYAKFVASAFTVLELKYKAQNSLGIKRDM